MQIKQCCDVIYHKLGTLHVADTPSSNIGVLLCADVAYVNLMQLNDSIKDEIMSNQRMLPPGKSLMALNGALLNVEDIDLHM